MDGPMEEANHVYVPPPHTNAGQIPDALVSYLDGNDLANKVGSALRLSTVDSDGWPHAALLSPGEVLALDSRRIRIAMFPKSGTAENLRRDGRLTLTLPFEKGLCEMRMRAHQIKKEVEGVPLHFFEATVEDVRKHVVPYADVLTGVTYSLHEGQTVLERWSRQIAALRSF
jgi:hypothetical protein